MFQEITSYPFTGYSGNAQFQKQDYNPKSDGYRAIQAAAKGKLEVLSQFLTTQFETVNSCHRVTKEKEEYYTPLYYALVRNQWESVALLSNSGIDWTIAPRIPGKSLKTPIDILSSKENGLVLLVQSLLNSGQKINFENLLFVFTHPDLSSDRRQEVINDRKLRLSLCERFEKDEALVLMASLMIGAYQWKNIQTDLARLSLKKGGDLLLDRNGTLCCNQMLAYASHLTGVKTLNEVFDIFTFNMPNTDLKDHSKLMNPFLSRKEWSDIVRPVNNQTSFNLGLRERSNSNKLDLSDKSMKIQTIYFENAFGIISHYGLICHTRKGPLFLHITKETVTVACESAVEACKREKDSENAKVYSGMLPWHGRI